MIGIARRLSARYCDVDDRDAVVAQFKRVFATALRNARRAPHRQR